jgi:hypothetical protein
MDTKEIANRLASLCKEGEFEKAQEEFFTDDTLSVEPSEMPGFPKEVKGLDAIKQKGKTFQQMVEAMHSLSISEPVVAGNSFGFTLEMDATMKERGRTKMSELCVYEVKDGKIVSERFFV